MDDKLDSLLLQSAEDYENLIPLLGRYAEFLTASNSKIIGHYFPLIEETCKKWESEIEVVRGIRLFSIGLTNYFSAKFEEALQPLEEAMEILKNSKFPDLYAMTDMIYGGNNRSLGEFDIAVKHLIKGRDLVDATGHFGLFKGLGSYQLGEIYVHINDFEAAERNYKIAVDVAEEMNNDAGLFRAYNGMANFCLSQNQLDQCKHYLDLSLNIEGLTDSQKSRSYCDLGIYYHKGKDYINSEKNLLKSYNLRIEAGLKDAASTSLINLSRTQIELNNLPAAIESLQKALELCKEAQSKSKVMQCHELLAKAFSKNNEWEKSAESYEIHSKLQTELNTKQLQNIYTLKNEQIKKQKAVIEEAHKETTDSINYARRIQNAILPTVDNFKSHFKESFVLYKPKDIVAGDFYWLEPTNDMILFAAADCTGHGVPGAMLSVVCSNALNRSAREYELTDPGMILDKTREIVIQEFDKSDDNVKDGMDIALCSLQGNKLQYAGAHNPLWIVSAGEILEIKANKQPIGIFDKLAPYTTHKIELKEEDSIYIFSDGFVDQFGGEKGKKFKAKALRELLLGIQDKSMDEQLTLIDGAFETWRGEYDQVDDVCVIGVRI